MSTRACIARPDGDSWRGIYVHGDGYPSALGVTLVALVRGRGVAAVLALAERAPQGWTRFPDEPSVYHDEPYIITADDCPGNIEWLYVLSEDGAITVYGLDPIAPFTDDIVTTLVGRVYPAQQGLVLAIAEMIAIRRPKEAMLEYGESQP